MSRSMQRNIRNLLIAQVIITLAVAAAFYITRDGWHAIAAVYGGSLLMLSTAAMIWKFRKAEQLDGMNFQLAIYGGLVQRFIIAIVGFAIGIKLLKLMPVPQVVAFGIAYFSFVIAARIQKP